MRRDCRARPLLRGGGPRAYTMGYSCVPRWLVERSVDQVGLTLVDIRLVPRSVVCPEYDGAALRARFGPRYVHLPELGNVNPLYACSRIADLEAGLALLNRIPRPLLMCACRDMAGCHRAILAMELRRRGWTVYELSPQDEQLLGVRTGGGR